MNFDLATIASYCASLSTIIALVVLIVKPIRQRFVTWISKTSDRDNINRKIDNLTELMEKQITQNNAMQEEIEKQNNALQATLRNCILNIYYKQMQQGYITMYEKQNLGMLFEQYSKLGGNCFVHECVQQLNNLPIKNDGER